MFVSDCQDYLTVTSIYRSGGEQVPVTNQSGCENACLTNHSCAAVSYVVPPLNECFMFMLSSFVTEQRIANPHSMYFEKVICPEGNIILLFL